MHQWSELDNEELLTTLQLANWLKISKSKLEKARMSAGSGPRFIKLESNVRYRVGDVRQWIDDNSRESTRIGYSDGLDEIELPVPDLIERWLEI